MSEQGVAPEQHNEGVITERDRKFADSPLEGDGFELPVREHEQLWDSETAMRINLVSSVLRLS